MNIVITILACIAAVIALVLIVALFMRRKHYVKREIVISAPRQEVFDYIRFLKNQDSFNKNAMAGGNRHREYRGTDGTAGFVYAWKGDKNAGEGEKEIIEIVDGKRMEAEIRFVKPMEVSARIVMETESLPDNTTKVSWSNAGMLRYPINIMIPMMERMLPKDMDASLVLLKGILEKPTR